MTYSGRRILVTGGGGFIASHLCEALVRKGATVRALVHYRSDGSRGHLDASPLAAEMEIVAGDVRDPDSVTAAMSEADVVFHTAALIAIPYSYVAPSSYITTNLVGTMQVLQAARALGTVRVVHTSTSEVYGSALYTPMDEAHPIQTQSPYAASKAAADRLAEAYWRSFGVPVVTVRPFNTYGPRQSARAIVPTIISQVLAGGPLRLGSLDPVRDLTYVADTVAGFLAAGAAVGAEGRVVKFGTGRGVSVGDLARLIMRLMGREVPIVTESERVRPERSEVQQLVCDARAARALLGWEPRVSLEDGLERTIAWMGQHQGRYRAEVYAV